MQFNFQCGENSVYTVVRIEDIRDPSVVVKRNVNNIVITVIFCEALEHKGLIQKDRPPVTRRVTVM